MKRYIHSLLAVMTLIAYGSCRREDRIDHLDSNAPAPAPVTNPAYTGTPGGALVTYEAPRDPNLAYIKAVYEIAPGVIREAKSSYYTDTLKLEGYGDTSFHEVQLYSIGRNEKASDPVTLQVKPLTPPVYTAFSSLQLEPAFGGVKLRFQNPAEGNMAIILISDTTGNGVWTPITTFYTKAPKGVFSYRGLPPRERKYAIYLRDRWNNKSDTLVKTLTPLFEEKVPKPFKALILPTDETIPVESQYPMDRMWDDRIDQGVFATRHSSATPQWFTIDLQRSVVISRMKMHQRGENYTYTGSNVKSFELWGTNDPDQDGGWTKWVLMGTFQSYKPSGLPPGQVTAEDRDYGHTKGEDFDMPDIPAAYRYLRFKTTATYGGGPQITIAELSFWGQLK